VNVRVDWIDFGSNIIIPNGKIFGDIIIHYNIPSGISDETIYLNGEKSDSLVNPCNVFKYIVSASSEAKFTLSGDLYSFDFSYLNKRQIEIRVLSPAEWNIDDSNLPILTKNSI
jgi:hypothetical protein